MLKCASPLFLRVLVWHIHLPVLQLNSLKLEFLYEIGGYLNFNMPCSQLDSVLEVLAASIIVEELSCSEDGGSVFFQNIDTSIPDYMVSHPRRPQSQLPYF
jgi:hypothetical protein